MHLETPRPLSLDLEPAIERVTACLAEAMPHKTANDLIKTLKRTALIPIPEIGYS